MKKFITDLAEFNFHSLESIIVPLFGLILTIIAICLADEPLVIAAYIFVYIVFQLNGVRTVRRARKQRELRENEAKRNKGA